MTEENDSLHIEFSSNTGAEASALSPKSPSSAFTKSELQDSGGCIIQAIMLAYWDNILGPKIQHLWYSDSQPMIAREVLTYIANHTLNGEICRDPSERHIDNKFYAISEKNVIVSAFIFSAMSKMGVSVFSLSLISPLAQRRTYLSQHTLCVQWMKRLIGKLRILLEKDPGENSVNDFSSYIPNFVSMLKSLKESGVPAVIDHTLTAFDSDQQVSPGFLERAILSHLITCRRSVVIGRSPSKINLVVATLALFLTQEERLCSRFVNPDKPLPYHHDLCVQGLLKASDGSQSFSLKETLYSQYPTTLIDVNSSEVRQTPPCHLHILKRHQYIKQELCQLWVQQSTDNVYPMSELFSPFEDTDTLVKNFLEEIMQLHPGSGVRESYTDHFMRLIDRKALALIKYVQEATQGGKYAFKGSMKRLKSDLDLTVPGDFKIVLAAAELLKPGLYEFLLGDPKLLDGDIQHLLETF